MNAVAARSSGVPATWKAERVRAERFEPLDHGAQVLGEISIRGGPFWGRAAFTHERAEVAGEVVAALLTTTVGTPSPPSSARPFAAPGADLQRAFRSSAIRQPPMTRRDRAALRAQATFIGFTGSRNDRSFTAPGGNAEAVVRALLRFRRRNRGSAEPACRRIDGAPILIQDVTPSEGSPGCRCRGGVVMSSTATASSSSLRRRVTLPRDLAGVLRLVGSGIFSQRSRAVTRGGCAGRSPR